MTRFEPDTSFTRRRRRGGGDTPRTLAAVLTDGSRAEPPAPPPDVFTSAAASEPVAGDETAPVDAPDEPTPSAPAAAADTPAAPPPTPADAALTLADDELAVLLAGAATEGRAAAETEAAQRLARAEAALADALAGDLAARAHGHAHDAELITALVRTIAAHVVPRAVAAAPLDDLEAELPALLSRLEGPERVTVAVHPELQPALAARLDDVTDAAGFTGTLAVDGDDGLALGDAVVRWPAGEASRRLDTRIEEATRLCAGWLTERGTSAAAGAAATTTTTTEGPDEH